jgi:hypothetical protein
MAVILKCPECREKFRWEFSDASRWPKACPLCKADIGVDDDDGVICMPALKGAATSRIDASYRELETSSERRMEQAAQDAGCSVSEMSALKITDIKTGVKPGESYVPEVHNAVTERMDQMKQMGAQVGFAGAAAAELAGAVRTGPHPNAGANTLARIQRMNGR